MFVSSPTSSDRPATRPLTRLSARTAAGTAQRLCRRAAEVGTLLAMLASCGGDVPGLSGVEGVYALRQLNGDPVPYDNEGLGCCTYLEGTLELDGQRYAAALTARNRNTSEVFTATESGSVVYRGSSLTFSPESSTVAPLLLDAGTVSADTLRLTFGGEGPGSGDQFEALYVRSP